MHVDEPEAPQSLLLKVGRHYQTPKLRIPLRNLLPSETMKKGSPWLA